MKKTLVLVLALMLCVSLLAACGNTNTPAETQAPASTAAPTPAPTATPEPVVHPTDPLEMITDGYYTYGYYAEGYGDFYYFFHFYPDDPVLGGGVYYAGFLNNGNNFAGLYTVEEAPCDYACHPDREAATTDGAEPLTGTAPYTIHFMDWLGNEIDKCGFDGDIVYNDLTAITAMASGPVYYLHDIDGAASKQADLYANEAGVPYLSFVGVEDELATLDLSHNRTYVDLVGMIVEGTWAVSPNAEGGYDYTLTTNAGKEDAVISVSADTRTAVYTKTDGSLTLNMVNAAPEPREVAASYVGVTPTPYGVDGDVTLTLYADGGAETVVSLYGNEAVLDQGTWEAAEDGTITLTMDNAGEIVSEGGAFHYVMDNESIPLDCDLTKAGGELFLVLTGDGGMSAYPGFTFPENLSFYTDGTCELSVEIQGEVSVIDSGTYTTNDYGIPDGAVLDGLGEIVMTIDWTTLLLSAEIPAVEATGFDATVVSVTMGQ